MRWLIPDDVPKWRQLTAVQLKKAEKMDNRWHLDWTDQKSDWLGWVFHPFRPNCASSRLIENAQMAEQATPPTVRWCVLATFLKWPLVVMCCAVSRATQS